MVWYGIEWNKLDKDVQMKTKSSSKAGRLEASLAFHCFIELLKQNGRKTKVDILSNPIKLLLQLINTTIRFSCHCVNNASYGSEYFSVFLQSIESSFTLQIYLSNYYVAMVLSDGLCNSVPTPSQLGYRPWRHEARIQQVRKGTSQSI